MKQNKLVKSLLLLVVAMLVSGGQAYAEGKSHKAKSPTELGDQIPSQHQRQKTQQSVRREAAKRLKAHFEVAKANELDRQIREHGRHKGVK